MHCKSLYSLPKFMSKTQRMQVGNNQFVNVLFIIPVILNMHGHRFDIYTLVSEIHENIDLDLGIKNVFELEGAINWQDCCFNFLNGSLPFFPKNVVLKPNEQKLIKEKASFIDEIFLFSSYQNIRSKHIEYNAVELKFVCNAAMLDIVQQCPRYYNI